jgi:RNA recognition motif-containing protein
MKLYVGNLPFSVTDEALKKAFSEFGDVEEATIIMDRFSNRSKGFGFVTFSDDEAAKKAIAEMNEKDFEGRNIKVSESKPREEGDRPRRDFNRGGNRGGGFGGRDNRRR